ncbi:MAG: N-acetylmuramoyl-L-alanine amidase [Alphaproteobacteria bacterium]|nr:N-acetylmuramoyl-L-alanine amidase [Alphaproteobacteria bacterium]
MLSKLKKNIAVFFKRFAVSAAFASFCLLFFCRGEASAATIQSLRIGQNAGGIRIVFDTNAKIGYNAFLLSSPHRLVIDFENVTLNAKVEKSLTSNNVLENPRIGRNVDTGAARLAFDLKQPAVIKKAFMLPPQINFGWRFVVDLEITTESNFSKHVGAAYAVSNDGGSSSQSVKKAKSAKPSAAAEKRSKAQKIIVLDPGHGGQDPGAIGVSGVYEKNITLSAARELKKILDAKGEYKVYMTRNRDVFIPLRERVKIARRYKADLFLSIHADSALNHNAKGLSVYTLSEKASDKEAAALAERENKADVIAGLNFAEHSKEVSDILINLAQRETLNRSSEFATFMVSEMRKSCKLLDNTHRFAGFAVLKAPDIPSVLLEMGYLSNRSEEKLLRQLSYRQKLAKSAAAAIDKYFDNMHHASLF